MDGKYYIKSKKKKQKKIINFCLSLFLFSFRSSLAAVKEFEVYLRECASTEDNYVKNLG